jgi:hypothetical protein
MKSKPMVIKGTTLITTQQAARILEMTTRNVQILCKTGKIQGAFRHGRDWVIPNPPKIIPKGLKPTFMSPGAITKKR